MGHARVLTDDQNLTLPCDALEVAGCDPSYEDTRSSAKADRPGLQMAREVARGRAPCGLAVGPAPPLARRPHRAQLDARAARDRGRGPQGADRYHLERRPPRLALIRRARRVRVRRRPRADPGRARRPCPRPQRRTPKAARRRAPEIRRAAYHKRLHATAEFCRPMGSFKLTFDRYPHDAGRSP
jgi:hypothetical protein